MEGERLKSSLLVQILVTLMIPDLIYSRSYPIFASKRFGKAGSPLIPALVPMGYPAVQIPADFEVPDYDDNYTPFVQMDEDDKYSFAPMYGYLDDQPDDDSFIDFEEDPSVDSGYPYGRESWFNEGDKENNAAYLRNLMLSEVDQEPEENEVNPGIVYGTPVEYSPDYEDEERDRTWYYGVPVYEERDRTRGRKGDSVRELESLTRQIKAEEARALRNGEMAPLFGGEILRNQFKRQMNRDGRKNNIRLREGFKMNEKRFYSPKKVNAKANTGRNFLVKGKESDRKNKTEVTTSIPKIPGQKEYVLPRPASPVRNPMQRGIYTRNAEKGDVYEAIKKLLAMEGGLKKESRPRIQKRFVLSEDQLTSQLSGLKRISVK